MLIPSSGTPVSGTQYRICTSPAHQKGFIELDGSVKLGRGECTRYEWENVRTHAFLAKVHRQRFEEFRDAGLRASATRHKKAAEYHEAWLRSYADELLVGSRA